jgi:B-cell receptor-associated protein 31
MLQLLFAILSIELIVILTLSFANPIRKLMVKVLDLLKRGRGPLITKTVATTVFMVFGSTIYTIIKIYKRSMDVGMVNSTEEVLMAHHLLEASLMGNLLLTYFLPLFALYYFLSQYKPHQYLGLFDIIDHKNILA